MGKNPSLSGQLPVTQQSKASTSSGKPITSWIDKVIADEEDNNLFLALQTIKAHGLNIQNPSTASQSSSEKSTKVTQQNTSSSQPTNTPFQTT